jgi:hypothetical protein
MIEFPVGMEICNKAEGMFTFVLEYTIIVLGKLKVSVINNCEEDTMSAATKHSCTSIITNLKNCV